MSEYYDQKYLLKYTINVHKFLYIYRAAIFHFFHTLCIKLTILS